MVKEMFSLSQKCRDHQQTAQMTGLLRLSGVGGRVKERKGPMSSFGHCPSDQKGVFFKTFKNL